MLDRTGEQSGIDGWTEAMNNGALTRSAVVLGFAHSEELTANITPLVADGIVFA